MKKLLIAAAFYSGFALVAAQTATPENDKDLKTWYHKDFASTKVYGVNTENAYKFLESKGLKPKTVVVAVLDSGVEVDHPGLMKNMWKNPNEIPNNGKDDDNNGYVDDVYGWNFLGGKQADIDVDNMEVTRVVKKYKPLFEGDDSAKNKENQTKSPEDFEMYMKAKDIFTKKGEEAKQSLQLYTMINNAIPDMVKLLNGRNLTKETLSAIKPSTQEDAMAMQVLSQVAGDPQVAGKSSVEVEKYLKDQMKEALDYFTPQAEKGFNLDFDPRASIVGDNYDNYAEKSYGNNHYEGPDAKHGTHVAGIIAGLTNGTENQYGVASRVAKIMTVRAVPDGDERDKDVANAVRYAVDNGAKILNMSFGKPVSPGKNVVWDAFKYAEDKGVLLVKAAGNENEDIAVNQYFPTNYKLQSDAKPFITNMMVVGANTNNSEALKASFSNYNGKMVDVFAPGDKIYSTVPDGKYEYLQGTSMASPVVAGAAAVLLAYMPTLKPEQIIESFVKTSNVSNANGFDKLSRSAGVIDVAKAAQYAYANFYKAAKSEKTTKTIKKKVKASK